MEIRSATPSDLAVIADIQAHTGGAAAQWEVSSYLDYDCYVSLSPDGRVAGFLVSRDLAGEREILNLAVDPQHRRGGHGMSLVRHELGAGATAWFLEVRESNAAARQLYTRAGFREVGRRPGYYSDPPESGIVMRFLS